MPRDDRFQDITISNFTLGVNQEQPTTALQPNEFASSNNMVMRPVGSVSKRYGYTEFCEIEAGEPILALAPYIDAIGSESIFAVCNDRVWQVVVGIPTDVGLGDAGDYTLPARGSDAFYYRMIRYGDRMYGSAFDADTPSSSELFCVAENTGATSTFKAWRAGVHPPDVAPILAEGSAAGLTGTYKYVISYFYGESSAHGESNASASATITVANKKVTVTLLGGTSQPASWDAAHDLGIDKIRIYRTEAGGSDYYYLTETTSATSYTDNTADGSLDTDTIPQTDNYPMPVGRRIAAISNRLLVGNTVEDGVQHRTRVRWSLPGYPDVAPAQNYHDFQTGLGDITGIVELNGQTVVLQERGISALSIAYGSEYSTALILETDGPQFYDEGSTAVVPDGIGNVIVFGTTSCARFDGNSSRDIGRYLNSSVGGSSAIFDGEAYRAGGFNYGGGSSSAQHLVYLPTSRRSDPRGVDTGTWWPCTLSDEMASMCRSQTAGVFYLGGADGMLRLSSSSYTADGSAEFAATLTSGDLDFGMPTMQKRLVKILVEAEMDGAATFTWTTDFGVAPGTTGSFALNEGATATTPVLTEFDIPGWVDFRRLRYSITTSASVATSFTLHSVTFRIGATRPE